ncbi:type II toxin-antitoxin system VapC family toxin [uncultured Sphingomonas sp.]|uniref:type II toxin-antitoxin system VapC family toxin n=1 Tax=uncultured Sphingomonas sp. TaxID=158754 RepID=UPI002586F77B|nr:type II toxin-antitoxin system VapC family toxin [uncultured Sphingomonas sp.]
MSAFVDASILVAILAREPDYIEQNDRLLSYETLLWSPISRWEAIGGLARSTRYGDALSAEITDAFADENGFEMVSIGEAESRIAVEAHHRYGKGRHDAKLNMGDCFAYACARTNNAALLYKGDDFARTDLR